MLSLYRIQPNITNKRSKKASNTSFGSNSNHNPDLNRPQMTSKDLKTTQTNTKSIKKNKNIPKAGYIQQNIEINEQYLDELLHKNGL